MGPVARVLLGDMVALVATVLVNVVGWLRVTVRLRSMSHSLLVAVPVG